MSKSRASLLVIGILIAMLAASLLTVLGLYLAGALITETVELEFSVNAVAPKEYDGVPLRANGYTMNAGTLKQGHRLDVKILGEQLDSGSCESDLLVKVYDEKDFDVTKEYSIKVNKGLLTVTSRPLTVILRSQQVAYSGKEIPIENYDIYKGVGLEGMVDDFEKGELFAGHRLVISFPGRFENVGDTIPDMDDWTKDNFLIYDDEGKNVTKNYQLEANMYVGSTIEIVPRRLGLKVLDATKPFDGTPIECRYELVEGTLAAGHYIKDVKYCNQQGQTVRLETVGSDLIRVASIVVGAQEGYDNVPLDEELQQNYELIVSPELYGTVSVTKRDVTVWAKNVAKSYDGDTIYDTLSDILGEGVAPFTDDLPMAFSINSYSSILSTQKDVCDRNYTIENVIIKESGVAGADLTDQFEITYMPAVARITPVTVRLTLADSDFFEEYNGQEIPIAASYALINFDRDIENSIRKSEISGTCAEALSTLEENEFQILCDKTVKNAGLYEYGAELRESVLLEKFGKKGNVIFEFSAGLFEVKRVSISVEYCGTNGVATTKVTKTYDGREADLDYRNLRVKDNTDLSVGAASFRYVDAEGNPDYADHSRYSVLNYTVKVDGIRINLATKASGSDGGVTYEDVTENYTVTAPNMTVKIDKASLYATAGQSFITYEKESVSSTDIGNLEEQLRPSITFSGLAAGDSVDYDMDSFTLSGNYDRVSTITFGVTFDSDNGIIFNSKGEDVTNCYELINSDETVITVKIVKRDA